MKRVIAILIATVILGWFMMSVANGAKFIAQGATSQSITVVIFDEDGDPNTTPATIADLDLYIQLDGGYDQSAKADLAAHGNEDDAWDDLEAIHMGNGLYRIDIPDANLSDPVGSLLTYMIVDSEGSNRTAFYEVQLSPPVDVNTVAGNLPPFSAALMFSDLLTTSDNIGINLDDTSGTWDADQFANNFLAAIADKVVTSWDANATPTNAILALIADKVQETMDANSTDLSAAATGGLDLSDIGDKVVADMDANSTMQLLLSTKASSATHTPSSITLDAGWAAAGAYEQGTLCIVTDADASSLSIARRIKSYSAGRIVKFYNPLPFTPVDNDVVKIYADISVKFQAP